MKKIIAILVALGLTGGASMAQNIAPQAPVSEAPKIVTLPMQLGCFPLKDAEDFMNLSTYKPMMRGNLALIQKDGVIRDANDGSRSTLWYSSKENTLVSFMWNTKLNVACIIHVVKNVTVDEDAWRTVGRTAAMDVEAENE